MSNEGQEQTDLIETATPEELEVVLGEEGASLDPPTDQSRGSWTAAIIGLITVVLLFCTIVVCSAAAIAIYANSREEASVSGTITYRERMALPPDAVVQVQLEDVSLADAPSQVMGQQIITNPGQVPIPFNVPYDPNEIKDNHTYSVRVRIEDGSGNLMFTTAQHYGVITRGNPTHDVQVVVERVGGAAPEPESDLESVPWILGDALPDTEITVLFQAGRLGGSSGCNSYKGTYTTSPGAGQNAIEIGPLATTMMMCEQSIMDQENRYLAALQATTGYHVEENVLTLFYPGGTLLLEGQTTP